MKREEIERMRILGNRVMVRLQSPVRGTVDIGVELVLDTDFRPWEHVMTRGVVVGVPVGLVYDAVRPVNGLTWETELGVGVGDEVEFSYHAALMCFGRKVNPVYEGDDHYLVSDEGDYYLILDYKDLQYNYTRGVSLNGFVVMEVEVLGGGVLEVIGRRELNVGVVRSDYVPVTRYDQDYRWVGEKVMVGQRVYFKRGKALGWNGIAGTKLVQDRWLVCYDGEA